MWMKAWFMEKKYLLQVSNDSDDGALLFWKLNTWFSWCCLICSGIHTCHVDSGTMCLHGDDDFRNSRLCFMIWLVIYFFMVSYLLGRPIYIKVFYFLRKRNDIQDGTFFRTFAWSMSIAVPCAAHSDVDSSCSKTNLWFGLFVTYFLMPLTYSETWFVQEFVIYVGNPWFSNRTLLYVTCR